MMFQLSSAIVPPGGFIYDQPLADGSRMRITGASYDHVLELILKFRLAHLALLVPGVQATQEAVASDYNEAVCSQYPWLCKPLNAPVPDPSAGQGAPGFIPLFSRMLENLNELKNAGAIPYVDQMQAQSRANICMNCPQNIQWETNCGSCNQNLVALSYQIRQGRRLGADSALRGCRAFGTALAVSVWLADPGGDARYQPPSICWRVRSPELSQP